jgi:hypothetical protein
MKDDSEQFYVFTSKTYEVVPIFCPVCEFVLKTFDDILSYKESKTCFLCETTFIKSGMSIDKESETYKKYINKRKQMHKVSFEFK